MKFKCICSKCNYTDEEEGTIELNFGGKKIFFVCPHCKFMNIIDLSPPIQSRYPHSRPMR